MRSLYFVHKDVEERVPSKRWDRSNCTYGSVRSKGSTYYTRLDELSQRVAYIGSVPLPSRFAYYGLQKVIVGDVTRIPPALDCESQ